MFYPKTDMPVADEVLRGLRSATPRDLGLSMNVVREAVASALPGAQMQISPLAEQGTLHRLFLVETAAGDRLIARFHVPTNEDDGFTLHVEEWAGALARSAGVPVPDVLRTDTTRRICPFDFQVSRFAVGRSLADWDEDADLGLLLRELGQVQARLHGVGVQGFGWPDVRPLVEHRCGEPVGIFETWEMYLTLNCERHISSCIRIGAVSPPTAARILDHFACLAPRLCNFAPSLLHGDLSNHNVRTDGRVVTAILDWEDCLAGDPAYDVAFWATFHPEPRHQDFLDGYTAVRPLPHDFNVRFWLYFLRVAIAKTVHRHRFRYADRPGRAPAANRIALALERLEEALR